MYLCLSHSCHFNASRELREQVAVVEGYNAGSLLLRTAQVAVTAMKEFQARVCTKAPLQ